MRADFQRSARAIGDPTRHRIFRYIADATGPVGVGELTEYTALNHNTVRQHLAVLKEAGLVIEEFEARQRPGRPRLLYFLNPDAAGSWGSDGPYSYLAQLLGEAIHRGLSPREMGRHAGRRSSIAADFDSSLDVVAAELRQRGFDPEVVPRRDGCVYVLKRCPYADAAAAYPGVVCELHRGLAEGIAESLGDITVEKFTAKNAHSAGCRITVRSA